MLNLRKITNALKIHGIHQAGIHRTSDYREYPKILDNALVIKYGNRFCCRKALIIEGLSTSLSEMGAADLLSFLRGYFKTLNSGFPIEVRTFIVPTDKDEYLKGLEKRISTLELILESNPSSHNVRKELQFLRKLRERITKDGLPPVTLIALIFTEACSDDLNTALEDAKHQCRILKNTLSSLGLRVSEVRGLRSKIMIKLFFRHHSWSADNLLNKLMLKLMGLQTLVGVAVSLMHPFILSGEVLNTLKTTGLYLGKDPDSGERVFWNINESLSPHVLVVGPTGSGKTEFLSILASRILKFYGRGSLIFDVKNEYPERLERRCVNYRRIVVGENASLSLEDLIKYFPRKVRSGVLTDVIAKSYGLHNSRDFVSALYKASEYSLEFYCSDLADCMIKYLESYEEPYLTFMVSKILSEINSVSPKGVRSLAEIITSFLIKPYDNILVIDVSRAASIGYGLVNLSVSYLSAAVKAVIPHLKPSRKPFNLRAAVILDEGWIYVSRLASEIASLMRISRSYGLMICIATQNIKDLDLMGEGVIDNLGLLVALASPDASYWKSLAGYVRISNEEVNRYTALLGRGEGIVRMSPDPRPKIVSFRE